MRMMLRFTMPNATANAQIQDGTLQKIMEATLARTQAEAAYFTADGGCRTGYLFFDMKDSSEMPPIAEPLFIGLGASVEFLPAMNGDDLKAGLGKAFPG